MKKGPAFPKTRKKQVRDWAVLLGDVVMLVALVAALWLIAKIGAIVGY